MAAHKKTHCIRGHEFTPENTYVMPNGSKSCKTCRLANVKKYTDKNRKKINEGKRRRRVRKVRARRTQCKRGHKFTPENTYIDSRGMQVCRSCKRLWAQEHTGLKGRPKNNKNQNTDKTHCIRGHEFTSENTYYKGKNRICRICHRADQKRRGAGKRSKRFAGEGAHTTQQELELKRFYGNKCLCCGLEESKLPELGRVLAVDHVIPLSKGGSNGIENLQPLCHGTGGCNNKKRDKAIDYREAGYHYGT